MSFFNKKYCDICNEKIGVLGNKKLDDGNMCKNCAKKLSPYDIQFISERLRNKEYLPYSYFEGSTPKNGYTPSKPYTIKLSTVPTSFDEKGYAKLYIQSSGADSLRPVQLRQRPSSKEWFLWEQMLLSDIRIPISEDLWA